MAPGADEFVVAWPTLFVVAAWIEQHCRIPDGFHKGKRYEHADWQLWCTLNHYRVKATAIPAGTMRKDGTEVSAASAFHNRRSQVVGPQKCGKGPWAASIVAAEGVGPVLFAGWAEEGDQYICAEHGCSCGWVYEYRPGEAKGQAWPTPLIQLTATSEDQVANVYNPLKNMIRSGPLAERMLIRTDHITLPNDGEIAVVTSSANSRLGNPLTFALQDETGLYTKSNKLDDVADTQRRGAAGMGGRSMETTNAWEPTEKSTAQQTSESTVEDVFKFHRPPPANLSYRNKRQRRKIHEHVYRGSWWVDLDSIDAEAAELELKDPGQAERFFGNRIVRGQGTWLAEGVWENAERKRQEPAA
ncbi:MAG: hypothetical protein JWN67_5025 [Actinomycetia bacterium]|nr:hypothetical protein [Actinomycetes bacterium]